VLQSVSSVFLCVEAFIFNFPSDPPSPHSSLLGSRYRSSHEPNFMRKYRPSGSSCWSAPNQCPAGSR
jgi:hypothetical protein